MNILLTGGTGFVGRHFLDTVKTISSDKIFALSRNSLNPVIPNVTWIYNYQDYAHILSENNIEAVIHLAGKAHDTKNVSEAQEYTRVNYQMTIDLFNAFANSDAKKFIFLSTIKATGDDKSYVSDHEDLSVPQTPYATSKREAEKYIQSFKLTASKYYYILRPVLIYGTGVKGNLATLVKFAKTGLPYPFESFENKRSYLSVNNLILVFTKILLNDYPSFTINLANEDPVSTKELIQLLYISFQKKPSTLTISANFIRFISLIGNVLPLPLNTEKLKKITSSFVVDTAEMTKTLGFSLPEKTRDTISVITRI